MGFNLVDMAKEQIGNQVAGYIGNMLGGDEHKSKSVLEAAIPALIGGLAHTASNPSAAKSIFDAVQNTDDSILDNLSDMLSGGKSNSLIEMGTSLLGSALGGGSSSGGILGNIINAVSGYSGVGKKHTSSIMGLLAPLIFSLIKKQLAGSGSLSLGSLVKMLTGQKENAMKALPGGLNLDFDNDNVQQVAREGKSFLGRIVPLLLLLAAAWFAYNTFFKGASTQPAANTAQITQENLGQHIEGTMKNIVTTLGGIKDASSAKAALPALNKAIGDLDTYGNMMEKLPANVQGQIKNYIGQYIPMIKDILNKIGSFPGVATVIQPVVEQLGEKLAKFQ